MTTQIKDPAWRIQQQSRRRSRHIFSLVKYLLCNICNINAVFPHLQNICLNGTISWRKWSSKVYVKKDFYFQLFWFGLMCYLLYEETFYVFAEVWHQWSKWWGSICKTFNLDTIIGRYSIHIECPLLDSLLETLLNLWMWQWIWQWIQQTATKLQKIERRKKS